MTALRSEQLPARPGVVDAHAAEVVSLVAVTAEMVRRTAVLEEQVKARVGRHPDVDKRRLDEHVVDPTIAHAVDAPRVCVLLETPWIEARGRVTGDP